VKVYTHPLAATADRMHGGVSDYLERSSAHKDTAEQLRSERSTPEGVVWQNINELRLYSHENELSEVAWKLAQQCMRDAHRAQMKVYQHSCLCAVRSVVTVPCRIELSLTLAEVASKCERRSQRQRAPERLCLRPVLSSCHASNAPGALSHVHTSTEVSSP
jgi:hypothetical protein